MKKEFRKKIRLPSKGLLLKHLVLQFLLSSCFIFNGTSKEAAHVPMQQQIQGTVSDSNNTPLPGVSVLIVGTTQGVVTDFDGKFSIEAEDGDVLEFSYMGMNTKRITVSGTAPVQVVMEENFESLDEVIVTGYGTQKKGEVTAAISSIDAGAIEKIATSSGIDAIKGQVAGVDIQSQGGRPGENVTVRIRGRRSIGASNDPLYVIDGIPQISGSSSISDINPQDIESMQVLKDAAATAIYGSRGANGVILISTKRGKAGKTTVSYSSHFGVTSATRLVDMMNGQEYADMKRESRRSSWDGSIPDDSKVFLDPVELKSIAEGRSTDWLDKVVGSGWQTNHQIGISGGSEKTTFNAAIGYFKEEGTIPTMDYERYTGRINLDHKISDMFKVGMSFTVSHAIQNWGSSSTIGEALAINPLGVPYDNEGNLLFLPTNDGQRTNPLNELVDGAYIDERKFSRIFVPIYLDIYINQNLKWTTTFGPDIRYRRRGLFRGSLTNANRGGPGDASIEHNDNFGYTLENLLTYNQSIAEDHNLKVTLLQSIQKSRQENSKSGVSNIPYEEQQFYNLGSASVKGDITSGLIEWSLASFMGRVNYDIGGKYLFQASLRADGSSRLAQGNKWNYFPGLSAGWRISEEPFMENVKMVNDLKIRASYGEVGNTSVDPYQTAGRLEGTTYAFGKAPALGFGLNELPNPNLGWEVSKTIDIGLDYSLFNGKIQGSVDWYRTQTSDILLNRSLPYTSGYEKILQNIGATSSKGLEFNIDANIIDNEDGFKWNLAFNIAGYKEKITELALKDENGNSIDDVGNQWFIGKPINVFYDYKKTGIYQADEAELAVAMEDKVPGEIKLEDINGDGIITPEDRVILGSDVPDFYGGITNSFAYKGIDLSFFFYFRQGQMIQSRFHNDNNALFGRYNNLDVDYWTINNPTNAYPRPNENQERPRNSSTITYFDGSYIKLRDISLGYNFPKSVTERLGMSNLRLYLSGQNLFFITKYDTFDPEEAEKASNAERNIIPSNKMYLLGLKVTF
ncbi:SusC/RagA family TonB-linked outer membrane protein [Sinomicrobium weinanense]|uniref:TonB-dependent receptor n=1 Tax=Sinomicrobium weinanense TaxID=2842200 RepID=A0A926JPG6_9FLAO|nr:TonB-dependent receptor [Sinomicrobium weinanense]MBC9794986.1 TonB-dependent receptor [Sinomicrobium weinanense]MBU3125153.1 TonB-dependent receptor [Sinomicrobium weinanense]